MKEKICNIVYITIFALIVLFAILSICGVPSPIEGDYSICIDVEKSADIENAISNAVSCLHKKEFVVVGIYVRWVPLKKCYNVYAKGIDKDRLAEYKP